MSDRYVFPPERQGANSFEREQGHEETPLRLTEIQRARLFAILQDELGGPISARQIMARIEAET